MVVADSERQIHLDDLESGVEHLTKRFKGKSFFAEADDVADDEDSDDGSDGGNNDGGEENKENEGMLEEEY
jgi:hypothetical protein